MKNIMLAISAVLMMSIAPLTAGAENVPDADFDAEDHVMPPQSASAPSATDDDLYVGADPQNFNDMEGSGEFYGTADALQDEHENK